MNSSNSQNNKGKASGVPYAIVGFIIGTFVTAITVGLFFEFGMGYCFESCYAMLTICSPIIGLVVAVVAGIIGREKASKN